jgi:hypothetical protein
MEALLSFLSFNPAVKLISVSRDTDGFTRYFDELPLFNVCLLIPSDIKFPSALDFVNYRIESHDAINGISMYSADFLIYSQAVKEKRIVNERRIYDLALKNLIGDD